MAAQEFTDLQRKKITETAYGKTAWKMNKEIKIDDGKPIGTVVKVVRGRDNVEGEFSKAAKESYTKRIGNLQRALDNNK